MKAIFRKQFGNPQDVLILKEVETPKISDEQILIKIKAVSISRADAGYTLGKPLEFRLSYGAMGIKGILGAEIAGEVIEVGSKVAEFKVGDKVFADVSNNGFGGFAEYLAVNSDVVAKMPENVSFTDAASLPQAAVVALQSSVKHGQVKPGMKVLVNGAAGGIGNYVLQICKAHGAIVTAVCSARQADLVKSLGADYVLDYNKVDFAKENTKYDLIIDTFASRGPRQIQRVLSGNGKYVMIGGKFSALMSFSLFGGKNKKPFLAQISKNDLNTIKAMVEKGKLKPIVDKVFDFKDTAKAVQHYIQGKSVGKVVVGL